MVSLAVGRPYPYPHPGGMQVIVEPTAEGLTLLLAVACDRPTPKEMAALRDAPLRLAVLSGRPLTWLALDAGALSYDAPYAAGITEGPHRAAIRAAAETTRALPETVRGLILIVVIDRGTITLNRLVSCSRAWWRALADSILANDASLAMSDYRRAVAADQARMTTLQMIEAAGIVEIGGKV